MKKYLFILGIVGTALFTACSTADDLVAEKPIETPPVEEPKETAIIVEASQDSEEPITLGIGQSRGYTRKPIDPTSVSGGYGIFSTETDEGRYLGVFCLATDYQDENYTPIENNWTDDDTGLLVRMNNVPAKVVNGDITFMNSDASATQKYYYPMGNWMKYNFYAYYPRRATPDASLQITNNTVVEKNYEIDGSQDIIWGIADPDHAISISGVKPYCAKYFRLAKDAVYPSTDISDYLPQLKFEHKLVQFRFFVQAADAATVNAGMKITNMFINNAISKLKLIVADKRVGSANKNGDLRRGEDSDYRKKLNIKYVNPTNKTVFTNADRFDTDGNGALDTPYSINETGINVNTATPVGYIMLPAPTISGLSEKYLLCLNYSMNDLQQPEVMQVELEGTFEAGSIYNVLVTVKSPEEISAKAILQEWDVVSTPVTPGVLE